MKKVKDSIFNKIEELELTTNTKGITTAKLANLLELQRSNVSSCLNELVAEGKLKKTGSKPKYYSLVNLDNTLAEKSVFSNLVGFDGSLKGAVSLSKAAILYPNKSMNILLHGSHGTGISYFAKLIYQYAKSMNIISENAPFIKINCHNYIDDIDSLSEVLFNDNNNLFSAANGGILFIDNVNYINSNQRARICRFIDTGDIFLSNSDKESKVNTTLILASNNINDHMMDDLLDKLPIKINLPDLKDRSFKERFELINLFLKNESIKSKRSFAINQEILRSLMLYDCNKNVKQLKNDIRLACANAYVREYENKDSIYLYLSDFQDYVRKGLLKYKAYQKEVEEVIPKDYIYCYDIKENSYRETGQSFYNEIDSNAKELKNRGFSDHDINEINKSYLNNLLDEYTKLDDKSANKDAIAKLVQKDIVELVENFLDKCQKRFSIDYNNNVEFGLSLHLDYLINRRRKPYKMNNDQIQSIISNYKDYYTVSKEFMNKVSKIYNIKISVDEIALITTFIISTKEKKDSNTSILLAMHGENTASSLKNVTESLLKTGNVYSFDMPLNEPGELSYKRMKDKLVSINKGGGVIVVFDMGSFKNMILDIASVESIEVRLIYMPITLLAMDLARKTTVESDLDNIYHQSLNDLKSYYDSIRGSHKQKVIVTLCQTAEGAALQLKNYIDTKSKLQYKTIPLAVSNRKELLLKVKEIRDEYQIHAFVGTFDPKLYGIPFISISSILNPNQDIDKVLTFSPNKRISNNYDAIYSYLDEQLNYVDINKIKKILPEVMNELDQYISLDSDQSLGIFVHLACMINRILSKEPIKKNINTKEYKLKYADDFKQLLKIMSKVEKKFNIIIPDDEIANILTIQRKL